MATNLQFIKQISTSGKVTNFDFTDIFDRGFNQYTITLNINDASGDGYIGLHFFDDSGTVITDAEYSLAGMELKAETSFDLTWRGDNQTQIAPIMSGGKASIGGGAIIHIFNADDSSNFTYVIVQSSMYNASSLRGTKTIGVHKVAEKVSGVRFRGQSHTYDSTATIYGVK
tara:strand:- start:948 stop:1460 length:513 start_codon:yes stop_codon:yes gene_type:complete